MTWNPIFHPSQPYSSGSVTICVPIPSEVKTSSKSAWLIRPSMMCALETPPKMAVVHASTFGSMPLLITRSAIKSSISSVFTVGISVESSSKFRKIPRWSVSKMSFSALSAAAISPAIVSAFILYVQPSSPTPFGAITGM